VRVAAAASLATAFERIGAEFAAAHPEIELAPMIFDGSSTLATQLIEGAPVDVFAAADEHSMQRVVDAGLAAVAPTVFASNTLVLIAPLDRAADLNSISDLADPDIEVVLCAPEVPCGRAAAELLRLNDVDVTPASLEQNVTAVLTKVATGEADAGLVYATDAAGSDAVAVAVPAHAQEVVNRYPITLTTGDEDREAAQAFIDFVTGPPGQTILAELGFGSGS